MGLKYLPAIGLAIINSVVQLLGVLLFDWPIGNIFLLLWIENVIVTLVAVARMAGVRNAPDGGTGTKVTTSFGMLFFCFVHGVFSVVLAFSTGLHLTMVTFVAPLVLLIVRYGVETISWYTRDERPTTLSEAHGFAMRRVMMLHVVILACWFIMIGGFTRAIDFPDWLPDTPAFALVIMLTIKTIAEVFSIRLGPNAPTKWKFQARSRH